MLQALLEAVPFEFSVLDKDDKVLAWNKHETRIFKRPVGVVGRDVRNCHPKKSLSKVEKILDEMKKGERERRAKNSYRILCSQRQIRRVFRVSGGYSKHNRHTVSKRRKEAFRLIDIKAS